MGHSAVDVAVSCAALLPLVMRASQLGVLLACMSPMCLLQSGWWACTFGISLNYFMHGFIWNCPKQFSELCGKSPLQALGDHPVDVFAKLEVVAKLVQLVSIALFLGRSGLAAVLEALAGAPFWCWGVLGLYVALGQVLNFAMYVAIGNAGVYYGFKYGREVPWCYGFPFNAGLRHPQYVGVVLTLWGGLLVLLCPALVQLGLPQAVLLWGFMYAVMSAMEQAGDNNKKS
mmetsp:Transcript_104995/g.306767  ORF Transcript_104995/g.306767 Transcript_104995/m.306767 type:complete len:230 (-) Transcript_104995:149-838(-)